MPPPLLSVVIAASNGPALLRQSLEALGQQARASGAEVIVVRNYDGGAGQMLMEEFAFVRDLPLPATTTVPALRAEGVRRARGSLIALLEDHCVCAPGWCGAILDAHRSGQAAVGGPVEQDPGGSGLDWAVYFYDYGRFAPPCPAEMSALPGCNMTFAREVLVACEPLWRDGVFEVTLFPELRRQGLRLRIAPDATVVHRKSYRLGAAIGQSWHLARGYAAQRVAGTGLPRRLGFAVASPALLVVLPLRTMLRALTTPGYIRPLVRALPALLALQWTWAAGEAAGYLAGAGPSLGAWR